MQKTTVYNKFLPLLFFLVLLAVGIAVFDDYGVHWDEYQNQDFGNRWHGYISRVLTKGDFSPPQAPFDYYQRHDLTHGPFFEVLLTVVQKDLFRLSDSRQILLMRHLMTFLLFYTGVFFFYLLCNFYFKNSRIALVGSLFLVTSPRIFAHAFYNSVDISFLSFYIISMYTLLHYLEKKTFTRASFHALTCSFLIATRQTGAVLPLYTIIFLVADAVGARRNKNKKEFRKILKSTAVYLSLLAVCTVLFWPLLWQDPLSHLKSSFAQMGKYTWRWPVLFMGEYTKATELPWYYTLVWIAISTPIGYLALFLIGCASSIRLLFKKSGSLPGRLRGMILFFLWFFLPMALITAYRGGAYDGWRHLFFVYPALLIIALEGLCTLFQWSRRVLPRKAFLLMTAAGATALFIHIGCIAAFMIRYHPYQNVYFNRLAGRDMKQIKQRFEIDYWGLSYRKGLEAITRGDSASLIPYFVFHVPGKDNAFILNSGRRKRLLLVNDIGHAKYFLSNYRWHPEPYSNKKEYYSIAVGNAKILVVYRIRDGKIIDAAGN